MGPEIAQVACVSTRATCVMADVNATLELLECLLTEPLERTTIAMYTPVELKKSFAMYMAIELKKSSPCVSYYQKGMPGKTLITSHEYD